MTNAWRKDCCIYSTFVAGKTPTNVIYKYEEKLTDSIACTRCKPSEQVVWEPYQEPTDSGFVRNFPMNWLQQLTTQRSKQVADRIWTTRDATTDKKLYGQKFLFFFFLKGRKQRYGQIGHDSTQEQMPN